MLYNRWVYQYFQGFFFHNSLFGCCLSERISVMNDRKVLSLGAPPSFAMQIIGTLDWVMSPLSSATPPRSALPSHTHKYDKSCYCSDNYTSIYMYCTRYVDTFNIHTQSVWHALQSVEVTTSLGHTGERMVHRGAALRAYAHVHAHAHTHTRTRTNLTCRPLHPSRRRSCPAHVP